MCGLCLKLIGSSEDIKISSTIAEWVKGKKYDKENEREKAKENSASNVPPFPYPVHMFQNIPFGFPPIPMPGFMGFGHGEVATNLVITLILVRRSVLLQASYSYCSFLS